jgi:hypothetical protein
MNIGLVDVDSHHFPNLCLMKLSAWYKSQGHNVDLLKPDDVLLGQNMFSPYDKIFGACVFKENREFADEIQRMGVHVAGTGTDSNETLPDYIEHIMPDYELYGITDTAYGFLTRGCPRACPFCIVAEKEGKKSRKVADLSEFWNGQKYIKLLDPNLLACEDHLYLLEQLVYSGARVDFTQGVDARLLNSENIDLLNQIKIKSLHFAWDNPRDTVTKEALKMFRKRTVIKDHRKLNVYVLCNYWSTHEQDLYRVYWLRDNGYDPYVMIFDKAHAPQETRYLQRWVNNKIIFGTIREFQNYDHKVG